MFLYLAQGLQRVTGTLCVTVPTLWYNGCQLYLFGGQNIQRVLYSIVACFVDYTGLSFIGVQGAIGDNRNGLYNALTLGTMAYHGTIGPASSSQSANNDTRFTFVTTIGSRLLDLILIGGLQGGFAYACHEEVHLNGNCCFTCRVQEGSNSSDAMTHRN